MGASKQFNEVRGYSGYTDTSRANSKPNYKGQGYVKKNYGNRDGGSNNNQRGGYNKNFNGKKPFNKNGNFKPKNPIQKYRNTRSVRAEGVEHTRERVDLDLFLKRCKDAKFVFKVFKFVAYDDFDHEAKGAKRYFPAFISLHKHGENFYMFNANRKFKEDVIDQAVKIKAVYEYKDGNIFIATNTGFGYTAEPYLSPKQFMRYYGLGAK